MAAKSTETDSTEAGLEALRRQMEAALVAVRTPHAGSIGTLECRLADIQQRFIATPVRTMSDLEARLVAVRDIVAGLGPRGFLLDLVEATLADVRALDPRTPRGG